MIAVTGLKFVYSRVSIATATPARPPRHTRPHPTGIDSGIGKASCTLAKLHNGTLISSPHLSAG